MHLLTPGACILTNCSTAKKSTLNDSFEKGISSIKVPFVSIIAFERLNASFEPYSLGEKSPFGHLEAFRMEKGLSIKVPLAARP